MKRHRCIRDFGLGLALALFGAAAMAVPAPGGAVQWTDGFESYTVGQFPNSNWTNSGNTTAYVTNTVSESGNNSLYLDGLIGQDWSAIAYRQFTPAPVYTINFSVENGSEALTGIHAIYGGVGLNTGPDWTTPGIGLISFGDDGQIHGEGATGPDTVAEELDGPSLGSYTPGKWYDVEIKYQTVNATTYSLSYWIDGTPEGTFDETSIPQQSALSYIGLQSGAGSAWFDNVSISTTSTSSSAVPLPPASGSALVLLAALGLVRFRGWIAKYAW